MTSHRTAKSKAAVRMEPAPQYEDWTVVNLHHTSDPLPISTQGYIDDTFEFMTPPPTKMHMNRIEEVYSEPWCGGKEEQPVDCFSVCTDSKKLGRPDINLLEEVFVSFL
ncbi:hypothetical protein COCOBI_03-0930 [Coccomyxa sp. Obi]|nr:hypothetical protein COCOBI_03-0930 [Coccomyxa sp. Obi]